MTVPGHGDVMSPADVAGQAEEIALVVTEFADSNTGVSHYYVLDPVTDGMETAASFEWPGHEGPAVVELEADRIGVLRHHVAQVTAS